MGWNEKIAYTSKIPCLHEIFFSAALSEADALDKYYETHGGPIGPLHGLPISLKDQINIRNVDTTTGILSLIGNRTGGTPSSTSKNPTTQDPSAESTLVTLLRSLGAIPYVKTATPTASFAVETISNLFPSPEYASPLPNPINRFTSSAGSSGGEAALLALRGSPVGFGSDIGGSIRTPAALCGLYGLKPSYGRLPFNGIERLGDGRMGGTGFVVGPMGNSAQDLKLMTKSILEKEPWMVDPEVHELAWNDDVFESMKKAAEGGTKLCFGVLRHDGVVKPQPPMQRALNMMIAAIEKLGHKVIEWQPPAQKTAFTLQVRPHLHFPTPLATDSTNLPLLTRLRATPGSTTAPPNSTPSSPPPTNPSSPPSPRSSAPPPRSH